MSNCPDRDEVNYEVLREAYDSAFQELAAVSDSEHNLTDEAARSRLEAATALYRQRRDALAQPLLHPCD